MSRTPPPGTGTYVYCIGHAERFPHDSPPFASPGIGGRGDVVRTVEYADLAAIVSDSPEVRYDVSRENLMAHQRVLEEAMTRSDVLPVAFGTVAGSDREVEEKLLKREFDELHRYLEHIRGRVELGLKALWHQERLFSEIVAENDEIRALRDSIADRPPDAAYYDRIELGERTTAAINLKRDQEAESILEALRPLAVETRLNRNLTDMMILNAAFLVDKDRVQAFDAKVQALGEVQAERLLFQYVGPLPPYNFVNVSVGWED
jgi:hypothetical protein